MIVNFRNVWPQVCGGLLMLVSLLASSSATAQNVTRGPYLQTATPTSVIVRWRTDVPTDSAVRYGTAADSLTSTESDALAKTDHEITLTGLSPDTRYYYSIGTTAAAIEGDHSYFYSTAPVPGTAKPFRVWFLGDSGTGNADALNVRDAYVDVTGGRATDLMVMLGDNAYNIGSDTDYQNAVFDIYPEQLRQMPWWPVLGNHDAIDIFFNPPGAYYSIVTMPTAGESGGVASGSELYYSFDYGDVHFVVLDSQLSDRSAGGAMMTWLAADLAANDKFWTIALWHHPAYSKGSHDSDAETELVDMRENAVPVLEQYGVDLVLAGHSHSYERSVLLNGHHDVSTTLTPAMMLDSGSGQEGGDGAYTKAGAAGTPNEGAVYIVAGSSGKIEAAPLNHPVMYTSQLELGSVAMDVAGNRLELSFIDDAGNVLDFFTVVKSADTFAPGIVEAIERGYNRTDVVFSEPFDPVTAADPANYAIPGQVIIEAIPTSDERTVVVKTQDLMSPDTTYTVTVSNVQDAAGNPIGPYNQQSFTTIPPSPGDVDGDGNIDWWDVANILARLNTAANAPDDPADYDGNGAINVLDARRVWLACELPNCEPINPPAFAPLN